MNAGSGSLSAFRVFGSRLLLTDRVPTGGSEPNAVAQSGTLVYVLNTAGSSSVVGFRYRDGRLTRIPDSLRYLSGNGVNSASLAFSPDGHYLAVTERATNNLDLFRVQPDGRLSAITVTPSVGPGAFSLTFAPSGAAIVSETGAGGPNSSAISSYSIGSGNKLVPISASVPTLGAANCWNAVTPDGRFVYASNAGTSSISGFSIRNNGTLVPLQSTVVGTNPAGATNLDIAVSADGNYLYSVNGGSGSIGMFRIDSSDGSLTSSGHSRRSAGGLGSQRHRGELNQGSARRLPLRVISSSILALAAGWPRGLGSNRTPAAATRRLDSAHVICVGEFSHASCAAGRPRRPWSFLSCLGGRADPLAASPRDWHGG